jgi:hypothetical protein
MMDMECEHPMPIVVRHLSTNSRTGTGSSARNVPVTKSLPLVAQTTGIAPTTIKL